MRLLKQSLKEELQRTVSEGTLFRGVSVSTRLVSHYMQAHGKGYVEAILSRFFNALLSHDMCLELDPNRAPDCPPETLERNCSVRIPASPSADDWL